MNVMRIVRPYGRMVGITGLDKGGLRNPYTLKGP